MITFIGFVAMAFSMLVYEALREHGRWHPRISRWTDWLVLIPGYGGLGCLLYSLYVLSARFLP